MKGFKIFLDAEKLLFIFKTLEVDTIPMLYDMKFDKGYTCSSTERELYNLSVLKEMCITKGLMHHIYVRHLNLLEKYTLEQVFYALLSRSSGIDLSRLEGSTIPEIPFNCLDKTIQDGIRAAKGFDTFCMANPEWQIYFGAERIFAPEPLGDRLGYRLEKSDCGQHTILTIWGRTLKWNTYNSPEIVLAFNSPRYIVPNEEEGRQIGEKWVNLNLQIYNKKQLLLFENNNSQTGMFYVGEPSINAVVSSPTFERIKYEGKIQEIDVFDNIILDGDIENMAYLKGYQMFHTNNSAVVNNPRVFDAIKRLAIPFECLGEYCYFFVDSEDFAQELLDKARQIAKELREEELEKYSEIITEKIKEIDYSNQLIKVNCKELSNRKIDVVVTFIHNEEEHVNVFTLYESTVRSAEFVNYEVFSIEDEDYEY